VALPLPAAPSTALYTPLIAVSLATAATSTACIVWTFFFALVAASRVVVPIAAVRSCVSLSNRGHDARHDHDRYSRSDRHAGSRCSRGS